MHITKWAWYRHFRIAKNSMICPMSYEQYQILTSPLLQNRKFPRFWSQNSAPCSYRVLRAFSSWVSNVFSWTSDLERWRRVIPSISERISAGHTLKEPCPKRVGIKVPRSIFNLSYACISFRNSSSHPSFLYLTMTDFRRPRPGWSSYKRHKVGRQFFSTVTEITVMGLSSR